MIVTLWEVAGSLPGNTGSKAIPWNLHIWDPKGLYIWTPALHRFLRIHRVRAWLPTLRYVQRRGDGGARQGLQLDSLEQFLASWPETGAPQCFYPFEVRTHEETGSTRRLYNLANVLWVAQPAAIQISVSEAPWVSAQEDATLLIEWALNMNDQGTPCAW